MIRVLIIDDSDVALDAVAGPLEDAGYWITTAPDGCEGLSRLAEFDPEVVISDLEMPRMDGIEFIRGARRTHPEVPILIRSSHHETPKVVAALREGAFGFLVKGASEALILQEIESAFAHRRLLREKRRLAEENEQYRQHLEQLVDQRSGELLRLQEEKARAEKLAGLGTLVGGIAHEINNPLAVIKSGLSWLKDQLPELSRRSFATSNRARDDGEGVESVEDVVAECRQASDRIERIVKSVKRLGRGIESGRCSLHDVVAQVRTIYRTQLDGRARIRVESEPAAEDVPLALDTAVSVLGNLFANAAQARTDGDCEISLRVSLAGEDIVLIVADNGPGFPEPHLARLGEPFFTTKLHSGGTGLGLNLVHQIVNAAGGSIRFANGARGGAEVTVRLPALHRLDGPRPGASV